MEKYQRSNADFERSSLRIVVVPKPNANRGQKSTSPLVVFLKDHHNKTYKELVA